MVSQERLKQLMHYDPLTGVMCRIASTGNATKIGVPVKSTDTKGYLICRIDKKLYRVHRLAFLYVTGAMPSANIDHKNGIKTDNAFSNLRDVSQSKNQMNKRVQKNNTSGHTGVIYIKQADRWRANVKMDGVTRCLGHFKTKEEAVAVRDAAAKNQFGEYHPSKGVYSNGKAC